MKHKSIRFKEDAFRIVDELARESSSNFTDALHLVIRNTKTKIVLHENQVKWIDDYALGYDMTKPEVITMLIALGINQKLLEVDGMHSNRTKEAIK